jgi:hypothetical protein
MDTSAWISTGASAIALLALGASLTALWKTHFAGFAPIFTVGTCSLRIYPIKNENTRWFLPSLDVSLSVANSGARVGKVEDVRMSISFPDLPIPGHYEMFYAKWEVERRKLSRNRFEWTDKAVVGDWMPFVILPRETITKHLVLESRWDAPVIQDKVRCAMQVRTSADSEWSKVGEWTFTLDPASWSELANVGTSFSASPDARCDRDEFCNPSDLHKYTGSREEIPKDGFRLPPSYLDYPKKKD